VFSVVDLLCHDSFIILDQNKLKSLGDYFADILAEDKIIIEIKTVKELDSIHLAQCLNYLKITGLKLCLLINFSKPKVEIRRIMN
jgi:GxxExxY protein